MPFVGRALLAGLALSLVALPAGAQFGLGIGGGQTPVVSVLAPTGSLADFATTGVGVGLRTSFSRADATWSSRMSFGIERFNGKKPVNSIQYFGTGFDVLHHSGRWYQFGGFTFSTGRTSYDESAPTTGRRASSGLDIGVTGGLGIQFGTAGDQVRPFLEAGYVNVFRDGGNDTWVPLRLGVRF
jgi:hypothetical protein